LFGLIDKNGVRGVVDHDKFCPGNACGLVLLGVKVQSGMEK
jgi:hypothetical protein